MPKFRPFLGFIYFALLCSVANELINFRLVEVIDRIYEDLAVLRN
jgi:hypothetical protein